MTTDLKRALLTIGCYAKTITCPRGILYDIYSFKTKQLVASLSEPKAWDWIERQESKL